MKKKHSIREYLTKNKKAPYMIVMGGMGIAPAIGSVSPIAGSIVAGGSALGAIADFEINEYYKKQRAKEEKEWNKLEKIELKNKMKKLKKVV